MDDNRKGTAPKPIATVSEKWIWRIVVAVILGEAIWGFLVSITTDLILPLIVKTIGGSQIVALPQKASFNVPGIVASFIELCLAGMAAILLNSWLTKRANSRAKPASAAISTPVPAPAAHRNVASTAIPLAAAAAAPANVPAPKLNSVMPSASSPPKPPKPEKAKPPKQVYYNIVGEPIDNDED